MRRIKNDNARSSKKIDTSFKKAWRKLKYLDRTQLNYFIVTSFIGAFCLFTGTTYSAFTISKYLNAANITIAKLNYTLNSRTSGFSDGTINVAAGETKIVDLTLTSNNPINTKYAINYNLKEGRAGVYYSQNLKYNASGEIGASGATVDIRLVIVNDSATRAVIDFEVQGGYIQNSLVSNISEGYYEQDITVRSILLDETFGNPIRTNDFPDKTSGYIYYKTVCSDDAEAVFDSDTWTLHLDNLDKKVSCDVYFKKAKSDLEVNFEITDADGNVTMSSVSPIDDGTYEFLKATCDGEASASWNEENWELEVDDITDKTLCIVEFKQVKNSSDK